MADWVCGRCKSINRERAAACYSCGGIRGATQLQPNATAPRASTEPGSASALSAAAGAGGTAGAATLGAATTFDGTGFAVADVTMPESKPARPAGPANLLGGLLGGAIGAAVAAGLWYGVVATTQWQIGLVAIAVGFVVGQAVVFGAAGRGSILLIPISLVFTLVSLVASEYLIARHFVELEAVELGVPVDVAQALFTPVELVRLSLESDPLTLVFWAIAGFQAFVIPMRAMTRSGDA